MKWKLVAYVFTGLQLVTILSGAPDAFSRHAATRLAAITIRVYDYAGIPEVIARRARAEVDRIFADVGIRLTWAACPVSAETLPGDPKCHLGASSTDIRLNLLTAEMAKEIAPDHSQFGAAFPLKTGFGNLAAVFPERISEFSARHGAPEALLLGHFMAHEIGHLLLGLNSHSTSGLMHVPWNRAQIERALAGTLLFSQQDADRIKQQVLARSNSRFVPAGPPG